LGGSSPLQDAGKTIGDDQEETVADIEKGEEKVEPTKKSPEPDTVEEKRLTNANLKTMDFLSLFLAQIEQNGLSFRTLSKEETDMVTPLLEENPDRAELDHLKVATIEEEDQKFLVFYDEKNQRTLVLNDKGQHLSQIPLDLI
ncbi:MAG: hypothetical protein NXH75_17590, partial [Halobacteriovoraceae bacterium]|nr:hypothetical protein [Halobacteriovoraceae bacterium]